MTRKTILVIAAWLGLFHIGNAFSGEPSMSNWQHLEIDLRSGGILRFSVPPEAGTTFPGQHHEAQVDISNDAIYRNARSGPDYFEVFNRVWDFKG